MTLIDTAGLRRNGKVFEAIEKFSVVKTLQAIEDANVVVLVLDATRAMSDQDAHIAGFALEAGRALVVAINKWDAIDSLPARTPARPIGAQAWLPELRARSTTSPPQERQGIAPLLTSVDRRLRRGHGQAAHAEADPAAAGGRGPPGAAPSRRHVPPQDALRPPGRLNPPLIVIHGNALDTLPTATPLPGTDLPRSVQTAGHALAGSVQHQPQSLRDQGIARFIRANPLPRPDLGARARWFASGTIHQSAFS